MLLLPGSSRSHQGLRNEKAASYFRSPSTIRRIRMSLGGVAPPLMEIVACVYAFPLLVSESVVLVVTAVTLPPPHRVPPPHVHPPPHTASPLSVYQNGSLASKVICTRWNRSLCRWRSSRMRTSSTRAQVQRSAAAGS